MKEKAFLLTDEIEHALDEYVRAKKGRNASHVVRNALCDYLNARGHNLERPEVRRGRRKQENGR